MPKYAIVNSEDMVENIIVWDGASLWPTPEGRKLVSAEEKMCNIGWKHNNGNFFDPNPPQEEPTV